MRKYLLPCSLILVGIILLAGCLPLPFPEQQTDKSQKDFRTLFGDGASQQPFRTGHATRVGIVSALGPAPYASKDGKSIGYLLDARDGFLVSPLCFYVGPNEYVAYIIRLDFDDHDRLIRWRVSRGTDPFAQDGVGSMNRAERTALQELNAREPHLEWIPAPGAPVPGGLKYSTPPKR